MLPKCVPPCAKTDKAQAFLGLTSGKDFHYPARHASSLAHSSSGLVEIALFYIHGCSRPVYFESPSRQTAAFAFSCFGRESRDRCSARGSLFGYGDFLCDRHSFGVCFDVAHERASGCCCRTGFDWYIIGAYKTNHVKTKSVEELQQESNRLRMVGSVAAVFSIAGAVLAGLVSVPIAAVVALAGAAVASISLLKKLADDRAVAEQTGVNQFQRVVTH